MYFEDRTEPWPGFGRSYGRAYYAISAVHPSFSSGWGKYWGLQCVIVIAVVVVFVNAFIVDVSVEGVFVFAHSLFLQ